MKWIFLLLSVSAFAQDLPFKVLGAGGPILAANGFPLTYNIQIESTIPLRDLVKNVRMDGGYVLGELRVDVKQGLWVFPYTEYKGLLQFLFIVPEDQPKGFYQFEGRFFYKDIEIPLPQMEMEIGGPH